MEECPSGRRSTLGKRVCVNAYRGFESHLLRVFIPIVIRKSGLRGAIGIWAKPSPFPNHECARVKCPYCDSDDLKVTDSRNASDTNAIRRRRECLKCGLRFTTFETIELSLQVHKRDGEWQDFDKNKLIRGVTAASHHTKISRDEVSALAAQIMRELMQRHNQQIEAVELGEMVMQALKKMDWVAYIRYACVYRRFKELNEVMEAIRSVQDDETKKIEAGNGQTH